MRAAIYARTSTADQHPDAQLGPLRAFCEARAWSTAEHTDVGVSGARDRRPALDQLLADARARRIDVVVTSRLDRLARSLAHLVRLGEELRELGVALVVTEQSIDTTTSTGRLMFSMLGAVAEFERDLLRERTRAGLAAARRRGRHPGRPPALDRRGLDRARRLAASGNSIRSIADVLGVSKSAVHRALATHQ